jgi:hypothetical protein
MTMISRSSLARWWWLMAGSSPLVGCYGDSIFILARNVPWGLPVFLGGAVPWSLLRLKCKSVSGKSTEQERLTKKPREALNKDLSLSLDSGRIRLCEAPCGADAALFRDSQRGSGEAWE